MASDTDTPACNVLWLRGASIGEPKRALREGIPPYARRGYLLPAAVPVDQDQHQGDHRDRGDQAGDGEGIDEHDGFSFQFHAGHNREDRS